MTEDEVVAEGVGTAHISLSRALAALRPEASMTASIARVVLVRRTETGEVISVTEVTSGDDR